MKRNDPRITVVTVCYNSVDTIEQTIVSVLEQRYDNLEYIIVDGESDDGTKEIINKYEGNISVYISEKDEGIYYAMNKGIDCATGELIAFINSDDWYDKDAIRSVADTYNRTNSDVIFGDITCVDKESMRRESYKNKGENGMVYDMTVAHPATFVKTAIMKKYHFNTNYKIAADYHFFLLLYYHKYKFQYIDKNLAFFRKGGVSTNNYVTAYETFKISTTLADENGILNRGLLGELRNVYFKRLYSYAFNDEIFKMDTVVSYLRDLLNTNGCAIFGYGKRGKMIIELLGKAGVSIDAILDNNGSYSSGKNEIIKPDSKAINDRVLIIVTPVNGFDEIKQQLLDLGVEEKRIIRLEDLRHCLAYKIHDYISGRDLNI